MSRDSCWDGLAPSATGVGRVMSHMWVTEFPPTVWYYDKYISFIEFHYVLSTVVWTSTTDSYSYLHFAEDNTEIQK